MSKGPCFPALPRSSMNWPDVDAAVCLRVAWSQRRDASRFLASAASSLSSEQWVRLRRSVRPAARVVAEIAAAENFVPAAGWRWRWRVRPAARRTSLTRRIAASVGRRSALQCFRRRARRKRAAWTPDRRAPRDRCSLHGPPCVEPRQQRVRRGRFRRSRPNTPRDSDPVSARGRTARAR